ncbi:MAG TPA: peptidylprolyl isomerase [Anaerolineales bacterium]|nr:peptidylprolyl isomerase [Anaerolineales bacterium]
MNNNQTTPNQVAKDLVVSLAYTLKVAGEILDEADREDPLLYLHGHKNIVPGLERALSGMKIGESKSVVIAPKDGYGDYNEDDVEVVPRSEFPDEIPLEEGVEILVEDDEGDEVSATIVEVTKDKVTLDFNHPLAGKELNFDVTIVALREATEEELEHGHAHYDDMEDDEDWEEDEDWDEDEDDDEWEEYFGEDEDEK